MASGRIIFLNLVYTNSRILLEKYMLCNAGEDTSNNACNFYNKYNISFLYLLILQCLVGVPSGLHILRLKRLL